MFDFIHISMWVGIAYLLLPFIPNVIWNFHKHIGYDSSFEDRFLLLFERVGEILVTFFQLYSSKSQISNEYFDYCFYYMYDFV